MSRLGLPAQRWSLVEKINKAIWLRCCRQLDLSDADRSRFLSFKLFYFSFSFWLSFSLRSRDLLFYSQKHIQNYIFSTRLPKQLVDELVLFGSIWTHLTLVRYGSQGALTMHCPKTSIQMLLLQCFRGDKNMQRF